MIYYDQNNNLSQNKNKLPNTTSFLIKTLFLTNFEEVYSLV